MAKDSGLNRYIRAWPFWGDAIRICTELTRGIVHEDSLPSLLRGEADAATLNNHVIGTWLLSSPGQVAHSSMLRQELSLAFAVTKDGGEEFVAPLNAGVAEMRSDGTCQEINDR